jgi:hypothetical protein
MGRTGRWFLAASATAAVLALSAATAVAAPAAADPPHDPPATLAGSPTAFAERIAGSRAPTVAARSGTSLQSLVELIVLTAVCAIGVAFYSSVSTRRDSVFSPARPRRR